jgi:hypothetical protein
MHIYVITPSYGISLTLCPPYSTVFRRMIKNNFGRDLCLEIAKILERADGHPLPVGLAGQLPCGDFTTRGLQPDRNLSPVG